jgi:hypothetical protein
MDKKTQNTDKLLSNVYKQCDGDGLKFLNSVFDFLNRRSSFLAQPSSLKKITKIVHNHITQAKDKEMQNESQNDKIASGITPNTKVIKSNKKENKKEKESKQEEIQTVMNVDPEPEDLENERIDIDENTVAPEGNGGTTDKYIWTQTLDELHMYIPVPAETRSK